MAYVTKYRTAYRDAYRTAERTAKQDIGYDLIPVIRPNFSYFTFSGLRPNTPHWIFFDNKNVTHWVNTSYDATGWNDIERNNPIRNPGDLYLNETGFPQALGGPTASSGPVYTNAQGELDGLFYIQSNDSLNFPIGNRTLTCIDISVLNRDDSLSVADAEYSAIGEYELYYEYQQSYSQKYSQSYQQSYQKYIPDPPPPSPSPGGSWSSPSPSPNRDPSYTRPQGYTIQTSPSSWSWSPTANLSTPRFDTKGQVGKYQGVGNNDPSPSGSGGIGCFLTTAIVDKRGEADDGVTLTKLRNFRDTYLVNVPNEVQQYYDVAPKIVKAIPSDHRDWIWIGAQIDKCVELIDQGLLEKTYETYKNMVLTLEKDWLAPKRGNI